MVETIETYRDSILISLFNAVNVDKALVYRLLALEHLLGENI